MPRGNLDPQTRGKPRLHPGQSTAKNPSSLDATQNASDGEAPETTESPLLSSQPTSPHLLPVLEALSVAKQEADPGKP